MEGSPFNSDQASERENEEESIRTTHEKYVCSLKEDGIQMGYIFFSKREGKKSQAFKQKTLSRE